MNINPAQAFKLDHIFWTKKEYQIAQQFIQSNSLLNKLNGSANFQKNSHLQASQAKRKQKQKMRQSNPIDQLIKLVYYSKIQPNTSFILQGTKKPHAIILLSGQIKIVKTSLSLQDIKFCESKKQKCKKYQKKIQDSLPITLGIFTQSNQTIFIDSDCQVTAEQNLNPDNQNKRSAQILFMTLKAYQDYVNKSAQQKAQRLSKHLMSYFQTINKKQALKLAQQCNFRQLSIGNHLYKIGQTPQQVFLLIQGIIKLESLSQDAQTYSSLSNYSQTCSRKDRKYKSTIVNATTIVGDIDIHLMNRQNNAVVLSSSAQLISIPKKEYFKIGKNQLSVLPDVFTKRSISNRLFQRKQQSAMRPPKLLALGQLRLHKVLSSPEKQQLPILNATKSIPKFQQQAIYNKMLKNSHAMMQVAESGKKRRSFTFSVRNHKNALNNSQQVGNPYEGKFSLYQKIRPNPLKIDINHRLF